MRRGVLYACIGEVPIVRLLRRFLRRGRSFVLLLATGVDEFSDSVGSTSMIFGLDGAVAGGEAGGELGLLGPLVATTISISCFGPFKPDEKKAE